MSQPSSPPKKSTKVRPGFLILLGSLFLLAGVIAAVIMWVIPAAEQAQNDAKYATVGGFAETEEQLDPRVANMYEAFHSSVESSSDDITGVLISPLINQLNNTGNAKPQPADEASFTLVSFVYFNSPETAKEGFTSFLQAYEELGYDVEYIGNTQSNRDSESQSAVIKHPENEAGELNLSLITSATQPTNNHIMVSDSLSPQEPVKLSGLPILAGSITHGEANKFSSWPEQDCSLVTADGISFTNPLGAWLEGYGCVQAN